MRCCSSARRTGKPTTARCSRRPRASTSNSLQFLQDWGGGYRGASHYRDVARAVSDGKVVSASGLAPVSFATEVLKLVHPEAHAPIHEGDAMFAREHQAA